MEGKGFGREKREREKSKFETRAAFVSVHLKPLVPLFVAPLGLFLTPAVDRQIDTKRPRRRRRRQHVGAIREGDTRSDFLAKNAQITPRLPCFGWGLFPSPATDNLNASNYCLL